MLQSHKLTFYYKSSNDLYNIVVSKLLGKGKTKMLNYQILQLNVSFLYIIRGKINRIKQMLFAQFSQHQTLRLIFAYFNCSTNSSHCIVTSH